jgi:hypothetical protein
VNDDLSVVEGEGINAVAVDYANNYCWIIIVIFLTIQSCNDSKISTPSANPGYESCPKWNSVAGLRVDVERDLE